MNKLDRCIINFLIIVFFITPITQLFGQSIKWIKTYGGTETDYACDIELTEDGGYIVVGLTESFGAGGDDIWLLRLDSLGDTLWTETYGTSNDEMGYSIQIVRDNGFIISGWVTYPDSRKDVLLIRVDSLGDTLWTRYFGDSLSDEYAKSVDTTYNNGFIVFCDSANYIWMLKINSSGDTEWAKLYQPDEPYMNNCNICDGQTTSDNGYIVAGNWMWTNEINFYIKTDCYGDKMWTNSSVIDEGSTNAVIETYDNCYAFVGFKQVGPPQIFGAVLAKVDSLGNNIFVNLYIDDSFPQQFRDIDNTSDSGFAIIGSKSGYGSFLVKTDFTGTIEWERIFNSGEISSVRSIKQTNDNGYIIAGSLDDGNTNVCIIKTDSMGYVYVNEDINADILEDIEIKIKYYEHNNILINFSIQEQAFVNLNIFDITGRKLFSPVSGFYERGEYSTTFQISMAGVYFYRLSINDHEYKGKIILL